MQREFWNDIGRTSPGGETSGGLLGTPTRAMTHRSERGMRLSKTPQKIADGVGSTSSVADSPANLFQWRDDAGEWLTNDGSGTPFAKWFESSDQELCLLKTSPDCSVQRMLLDAGADCFEEFSETFPECGSMRNGVLYRQEPLVRRISEKESSLLHGKDLLPTPYGLSANQGQGDGEFGKAIRLLPTPRARDYKHGIQQERGDKTTLPDISAKIGGLLNPQFVEAMMGLPIGWTDLEGSETQ